MSYLGREKWAGSAAHFFCLNILCNICVTQNLTLMQKFLQVNGKHILFTFAEGKYWVAVKPICDTLGVNYNRQFQNLKEDVILCQLFAEQQMVAADNRLRKMVCLPERYVYGWLFGLRSNSPELLEFKLECYDVLYNHFHGTLTKRQELINKKAENEIIRLEITARIRETTDGKQLDDIKEADKAINKELVNLDKSLRYGNQIVLFG